MRKVSTPWAQTRLTDAPFLPYPPPKGVCFSALPDQLCHSILPRKEIFPIYPTEWAGGKGFAQWLVRLWVVCISPGIPHNPMVNAGAIVVSSLIKVSATLAFWKVLFSKPPCSYIPRICLSLQGDWWGLDSFEGAQEAVKTQQGLTNYAEDVSKWNCIPAPTHESGAQSFLALREVSRS